MRLFGDLGDDPSWYRLLRDGIGRPFIVRRCGVRDEDQCGRKSLLRRIVAEVEVGEFLRKQDVEGGSSIGLRSKISRCSNKIQAKCWFRCMQSCRIGGTESGICFALFVLG